jgi:hypothetical protein
MRRTLTITAVLAAACVLAGCATTKESGTPGSAAAAMGAINDTCPISGGPVNAEAGVVTHDGRRIGFCCPNCPARWKAMSEAQKDAFVAQHGG